MKALITSLMLFCLLPVGLSSADVGRSTVAYYTGDHLMRWCLDESDLSTVHIITTIDTVNAIYAASDLPRQICTGSRAASTVRDEVCSRLSLVYGDYLASNGAALVVDIALTEYGCEHR